VRPGLPRVQVQSLYELGKSLRFRHANGLTEALFANAPQLLRAHANQADGKGLDVSLLAVTMQADDAARATLPGKNGWQTVGAYQRAKRQ